MEAHGFNVAPNQFINRVYYVDFKKIMKVIKIPTSYYIVMARNKSNSQSFSYNKIIGLSHGVLMSPIFRHLVVLFFVCLVHASDLGHERVVRVGVGEKRADGK